MRPGVYSGERDREKILSLSGMRGSEREREAREDPDKKSRASEEESAWERRNENTGTVRSEKFKGGILR